MINYGGLLLGVSGLEDRRLAGCQIAQPGKRFLASGPVQAYAQTKALLTREQDMSLPAAVELEAMTQALLMKGQDYAEFHAAFTAGREPRWQGR